MRTQIVTTARRMRDLDPVEIVELALDRLGAGNPSLEWPLHAAIYRARPDVRAIVHTHSPYAVARSFDPAPLIVETEERSYLELDRIDVAPPAPVGSTELADAAAETLDHRPAVLLGHHGVIGTGPTPRDALEICCAVEHQAHIAHLLAMSRRLVRVKVAPDHPKPLRDVRLRTPDVHVAARQPTFPLRTDA